MGTKFKDRYQPHLSKWLQGYTPVSYKEQKIKINQHIKKDLKTKIIFLQSCWKLFSKYEGKKYHAWTGQAHYLMG